MPAMTPAELSAFLDRPLVASCVTVAPDGSPRVTPVWFQYENGAFYLWSDRDSVKVRNISSNGHLALCIATHEEPYRYVVARGLATVLNGDIYARALAIAARYYGPQRGAEYAELARLGDSVVVELKPAVLLTESSA